ncbi:MAG: hypothetical protein WBX22_11610 [Silvibacterium sp.]|jgi:hypothetical protein
MTIDTEIDEISTEDRDESRFRALESRALKGTYFIDAFYEMGMGLQFAGSIIMTRLFAPELFEADDLADYDHCGLESPFPFRIGRQRHSESAR